MAGTAVFRMRGVERFHEECDGHQPGSDPFGGLAGVHAARVADGCTFRLKFDCVRDR